MSFDLLLKNGDITIGADQDFGGVIGNAKLIQDTIKIVTTPQGSNKFHLFLGSLVNERLIGQTLTPQNTVSILQGSVQEALSILQKLQKQQSYMQALSPSETLAQINSINVERDIIEPRQLNVILKIMAGDGRLLTDQLTMRLQ